MSFIIFVSAALCVIGVAGLIADHFYTKGRHDEALIRRIKQ